MVTDVLMPVARILDLTSCNRGVTDAGLVALSRCPMLQDLSLSYLHKVSALTYVPVLCIIIVLLYIILEPETLEWHRISFVKNPGLERIFSKQAWKT